MWLCRAMCDYVWRSVDMWGDVWLCEAWSMAMIRGVGWGVAMCVGVWLCGAESGIVWEYVS